MSVIEKQLLQATNILDTLLEAIEHFSILIKENKINQSVFMLSSIVNSFETIKNVPVFSASSNENKEIVQIEQTLLAIAKYLQQKNLIKISELLQFSLKPQVRNWKRNVDKDINEDLKKQCITIGVYYCKASPREVYPEARMGALLKESERQGINLFFFSSEDVDFDNKRITAEIFNNKEWQRVVTSFPKVIHNINITARVNQSPTEKLLRKEIPFTSFSIGNKFHLPQKLVRSGRYGELLVPFKLATGEGIINEFLKKNNNAVLKPLRGNRGENIYFVEKKKERYFISDHTNKMIMGKEKFGKWISEVILKNKNSYIIQHYIHCRTQEGEPYDIRAHVQKDGEGKWKLTKIYPRIGNKKSILSNISRGGRVEDLEKLLAKEFADKSIKYGEDIRQLSLDLTWQLDKLYGLALDELGLDLAIDENGKLWLHEVNIGPQSTYHESERAINTIAYAKYLAENQIFYTNEFNEIPKLLGQFNVKEEKLGYDEPDGRYRIAMLVDEKEINNLTIACAYVASYENVRFYYFSPKDIDYENMLIRGHFYENKQWIAKTVEYPNVIYDRLRLRGVKGFKHLYDEFEGIPFTNEFFGNSMNKVDVYDKLKSTKKVDDLIIPYRKIDRAKEIFNYIKQYGKVMLKPTVGSFAKGVHFISKIKTDKYFVALGEEENHYSELALLQYLRDLLKQGPYVVQKYIETRTKDGQPFDIRLHMMKDGKGEWSFVMNYPRVGIHYATISTTGSGGYIGELLGFLERNFTKTKGKELKEKIEMAATRLAITFESFYDTGVSELGLDMAIDENMNPYIIEINVNKPGMIYHEFEAAKHAISYAIYLAKNNGEDLTHIK